MFDGAGKLAGQVAKWGTIFTAGFAGGDAALALAGPGGAATYAGVTAAGAVVTAGSGLVYVIGEGAAYISSGISASLSNGADRAYDAADAKRNANNAENNYSTFNNLPEDQGYSSFRKLKKSIGSAGEGNDWHHIVEQSQIRLSGFESEQINNTSNIISVDHATHMKITGYYNSKAYDFTGGLSVREWLSGQSFEQQYEFGMETLRKFGVIK